MAEFIVVSLQLENVRTLVVCLSVIRYLAYVIGPDHAMRVAEWALPRLIKVKATVV